MKKKFLLITSFILVLTLGVLLGTKFSKSNFYEEEDYIPEVTHKHMLSMMLETDSGSGEYSLEERSSWPTKEDGYVFNSTLSKCEKGSKLEWDDENNAVMMVGATSDKCYVYFDVYVEQSYLASCNDNTLSCWVVKQYNEVQGNNNIYYHDSNLENGAEDYSYRYAGSSNTTNNFVCFGSDESTCPDDNLYRIIGVFGDQVKLIKWDYANSDLLGTDGDYDSQTYLANNYSKYSGKKTSINGYHWNRANYSITINETQKYNVWSYSELNTKNLNINFVNNINGTLINKIANTNWKIYGNTYSNIRDVQPFLAYKNEIVNLEENTIYVAKIGLMYVSDYGFAASPNTWSTNLGSYNLYINDNWMYMGLDEWTIVRESSDNLYAFYISNTGNLGYNNVVDIFVGAVRPVFYLNSDVEYSSGSGTKNDPIRIKID